MEIDSQTQTQDMAKGKPKWTIKDLLIGGPGYGIPRIPKVSYNVRNEVVQLGRRGGGNPFFVNGRGRGVKTRHGLGRQGQGGPGQRQGRNVAFIIHKGIGKTRNNTNSSGKGNKWGKDASKADLDKELDDYMKDRKKMSRESLDFEIERYQAITASLKRMNVTEESKKDQNGTNGMEMEMQDSD